MATVSNSRLNSTRGHSAAERHLRKCHPRFRDLIRKIGPCPLEPNGEHYPLLVRTIVSQQLSVKAAASILRRVKDAAGEPGLTPNSVQKLTDEQLAACGLSRAKVRSLRDLSAQIMTRCLVLDDIHLLPDEAIAERLMQVHGIGPWSVDMFLIFALGRPDVLPVGDLGFRAAVREMFGLRKMPTPARITQLCEPWRPYRSVAAWYCWRLRDAK